MIDLRRRQLLWGTVALLTGAGTAKGFAAQAGSSCGPLKDWLRHPLLTGTLYRHEVSRDYGPDGTAGANLNGYRWIEEQRQGAEWIVRGYSEQKPDWTARGWHQLDWGLAHQQSDGSFDSLDAFHSTSFFVEALARSCLIDPAGATRERADGLRRAASWLMSPRAEAAGIPHNLPYTHRRFLLAAAFGQAAEVTQESRFHARAIRWLDEGLALQTSDGTNPEKGGFDAGYQMVGVLMALRYLPTISATPAAARIESMVRKAIARELRQQRPDGSIDATGSTRIEREKSRSGKVKDVPYGEILQALVFGAQAFNEPAWLNAARKIATLRGW